MHSDIEIKIGQVTENLLKLLAKIDVGAEFNALHVAIRQVETFNCLKRQNRLIEF
jgi:hypothetical protein